MRETKKAREGKEVMDSAKASVGAAFRGRLFDWCEDPADFAQAAVAVCVIAAFEVMMEEGMGHPEAMKLLISELEKRKRTMLPFLQEGTA